MFIYLMLDTVPDPHTEERLIVLHLVRCSCWAELDAVICDADLSAPEARVS